MGSQINKLSKKTWLVTGAAGFIGSHIVEQLLRVGQKVVGLDNFSSGNEKNLENVKQNVGFHYSNFSLVKGDIRSKEICDKVTESVDFVLHQAAYVSVQGSIDNPELTHEVNVNGFQNILHAAKKNNVKRFIFASSSAVKVFESNDDSLVSRQTSPYALSKYMNEKMAETYSSTYNIKTIGLRYFNVYGPRQSLESEYSAVIPSWYKKILNRESPQVFGDGLSTRDFCFVADIARANILAALCDLHMDMHKVYEIATGESKTILQLYDFYRNNFPSSSLAPRPEFVAKREGEIRHSVANIDPAKKDLGYLPKYRIEDGLSATVKWFSENY
ncbi:MAG: NAD-dependent epimerase/dehydratase family protein [Oligoflexia bacterium]|nr:NAD-dependent epimerase/dehydratase family protein [Oligoflexia bacterium]